MRFEYVDDDSIRISVGEDDSDFLTRDDVLAALGRDRAMNFDTVLRGGLDAVGEDGTREKGFLAWPDDGDDAHAKEYAYGEREHERLMSAGEVALEPRGTYPDLTIDWDHETDTYALNAWDGERSMNFDGLSVYVSGTPKRQNVTVSYVTEDGEAYEIATVDTMASEDLEDVLWQAMDGGRAYDRALDAAAHGLGGVGRVSALRH